MIRLIKRLLCKHEYIRTRTIHGDEIIHRNFMRSEWECRHCGKWKYSKHLNKI